MAKRQLLDGHNTTAKFAIVAILLHTFTGYTNAILWPCETDADCDAANSICNLSSGLCACESFDFVFSENYTQCLTTSLFGDECEESVQCNLMPSGANCKTGVCDCADEHVYVRGRCRTLNGLGQSCDTDIDCYFGYDRESVACNNQVCACANGYYHRHGNICRRKSMEIDDACVVDEDCDALGTNVKCESLRCQYVDEIVKIDASSSSTSSTKLNASKFNAKSKTTTTLGGQSQTIAARPRLPPPPPSQTQHQSRSLSESQISTSKSDDSSIHSPPPVLALVNGRNDDELSDTEVEIVTDPKRALVKKSREIAVQTSIETFELKPQTQTSTKLKNVGTATATATASTSTSSRRLSFFNQRRRPFSLRYFDDEEKTFSTLSNTDDDGEDEGRKYGSACTDNGKSCTGLPHSICSSNVCLCKLGYYHKNNKCFAELGEIAESTDECEHTFNELSKKCICQKNYFYESNLRSCRKPIQFHLSCTANSQCSPFGAAYCHPEIPRRCTCEEYAEYDALQQMCVYKEGLGAQCETTDSCTVANSICSNHNCICKDSFFEKNGTCLPGIGATCEETSDCIIEDSICEPTSNASGDKDRACNCRKGFVHFKDDCMKEAEELGDECLDTEQCKPLLATCEDNKCTCSSEQHFKYGRCENKKGLGEACTRAGECYVEKNEENVECRNSVCQCKFDYQADTEQKTCIRVLPNKKNSSGRPSALKIITFVLIGSAFLITSAAIKQAYY